MSVKNLRRALWVPGWYELDQSIAVGQRDRFWFFVEPPLEVQDASTVDFVFFNQLIAADNCQIRIGTILQIEHPALGTLQRVLAEGLDYSFVRADGDEILVNAEEEPGACLDPRWSISDWSVRVNLSDVSEPLDDLS